MRRWCSMPPSPNSRKTATCFANRSAANECRALRAVRCTVCCPVRCAVPCPSHCRHAMSHSYSSTAYRNKRQPARDLSAPQLRELRKELLLVRADVERMEFAQATLELREAVTHFSWLKFIVPGF